MAMAAVMFRAKRFSTDIDLILHSSFKRVFILTMLTPSGWFC